ncbi:hypothetical protein D3C72_2408470 [compost metagenome]
MAFIDKSGPKAKTKFVVISIGRDHGNNLSCTNVADVNDIIPHLRPDGRIFGGLHVLSG